MDKKFKISVVVPIYKVEEYLEECLLSVTHQTIGFKDNIQLILVNDGSPDNSETICLKFQKKYPENVVYIKQKNAGVSAARNNGLAHATGEYINFLDSDDKWDKNAFKEGIRVLEENPDCDSAWVKMKFFDAKHDFHVLAQNHETNKKKKSTLDDYNCIESHVINIIFKTNYAKQFSFDTSIKYAEDMKFLDSYLLQHDKFYLVSNRYYYYRKRKDKSSATQSSKQDVSYYTCIDASLKSIFELATQKYSYIPRFFQYSVMYQLQYRIRTGINKDILTNELQQNYVDSIQQLLKCIDDDIIVAQSNINLRQKMICLSLKYGKNLKQHIAIKKNGIFVDKVRISDCVEIFNYIKLFEIKKDNRLMIAGEVSYIEDFELFYQYGSDKKIKISTYPVSNPNKFAEKFFYKGYRIYIPLADTGQLNFYIKFHGTEVKLVNSFQHFSRLNNLKSGYYYEHKYLLKQSVNHENILITKNPFIGKVILCELITLLALCYRLKWKVAIVRILYWLTKPFIRKDIWLFCDREFMAEDSAEVLFKYFNEHNTNKKIKSYFVIDKHYKDYKRMKKYGKVVSYHTLKYMLLFLHSKILISSHADSYVNNAFGKSRKHYISLFRFKYVYLTHGILLHDSSHWLNRINKNFALNVTTSPMEYDSIINGNYYFEEKELIKTGIPRYDNLKNLKVPEENKILFMPSWRSSLVGKAIPGTQRRQYNPLFKKSEYYQFYDKLFKDSRLLDALKKNNLKIKFCIHPSFREQFKDFVGNEYVEFAIDVNSQYETLSSKMLVTDYSSAACDFAYLNKPVVYANFDYDHIYEVHYYNKGYFDYDKHGFGPNCLNYEDTLNAILKLISNDFKVESKYAERMKNFFFYRDNKNSERVYNAIMDMEDFQ